jgi:DNA-binding NarL/FixJ family response regulator
MKRVLLADNHPLVLEGLRAFLEPHVESVETVMDGKALVEAALRLKPDIAILDFTLPLLNGIDAAVRIKKALPETKLIFVTMHMSPVYLEAALNAGGTGFVLKSAAHQELLEAIQSVLDVRTYVTSSLRANN